MIKIGTVWQENQIAAFLSVVTVARNDKMHTLDLRQPIQERVLLGNAAHRDQHDARARGDAELLANLPRASWARD